MIKYQKSDLKFLNKIAVTLHFILTFINVGPPCRPLSVDGVGVLNEHIISASDRAKKLEIFV